jgi:hypothetical protein
VAGNAPHFTPRPDRPPTIPSNFSPFRGDAPF